MELQSRIQIGRDFLALHKNHDLNAWVPDDRVRHVPPILDARQLKYLMIYRFLCWEIYGPVSRLPNGKRLVMIPGPETHGGNDEPFTWRELDEF